MSVTEERPDPERASGPATGEIVSDDRVPRPLLETLPWSWYTDDALYDLERLRVHKTGWHYVGPHAELSAPGHAELVTIAGLSIIVMADANGTVRAFPNVCRHRGAELIGESEESVARLSCRYHGWSWAPDGTLRAAPSTDLDAGDPDWALDELPLATWGPMLFVKPSQEGPDFDTVMGPLVDKVATRIDVASLEPVEREEYVVQANWKVFVENFNECYHCPVAHPEFSKVVYTNRNYVVERLGTYCVGHKVPLRAAPDEMYYFAYAWPTLALGLPPDGRGIGIISIRPTSTGSFAYHRQLFQPKDVDRKPLLADFNENLVQQDIDLCEMVQRGLRNDAYGSGALVESREQAVLIFHELVRAHMEPA
jgi:choline monooxygenase